MSRKIYARVERTIIALMMLGMLGMFQPLAVDLFRYGFLLLLLSTILFIIISHLSPKPELVEDSASASQG
jgi:hypothetical protein